MDAITNIKLQLAKKLAEALEMLEKSKEQYKSEGRKDKECVQSIDDLKEIFERFEKDVEKL